MVAINEENNPIIAEKTIVDAVCPNCFKPMQSPTILPERTDDYGRTLRNYFGYCFECNLGFEVVQFKRKLATEGTENAENNYRWIIHKFQAYCYFGTEEKCEKMGKWIILNELPEPAPIVIGPGRDYNKPIGIQQMEILKTIRGILQSICNSIDCLLKTFGL